MLVAVQTGLRLSEMTAPAGEPAQRIGWRPWGDPPWKSPTSSASTGRPGARHSVVT
jgi:hypothetical protein